MNPLREKLNLHRCPSMYENPSLSFDFSMRDKQINQWSHTKRKKYNNYSSRFQGTAEMLSITDHNLFSQSVESHAISEGIKIIRTTISCSVQRANFYALSHVATATTQEGEGHHHPHLQMRKSNPWEVM